VPAWFGEPGASVAWIGEVGVGRSWTWRSWPWPGCGTRACVARASVPDAVAPHGARLVARHASEAGSFAVPRVVAVSSAVHVFWLPSRSPRAVVDFRS